MPDLRPELVEKATLAATNDRRERHGFSRIDRLPWNGVTEAEKRHTRVALEAVADDLRAEGAAEALRDEYHTLDELYEYRMLYNALAANAMPDRAVKSWRHSDGEKCFGGGWFVVYLTLPSGQVSNHYKAEHWDLFQVPEADLAPAWDGHTPAVAERRLYEAVRADQIAGADL